MLLIRAIPNSVSPRRTTAVWPGLATEVRGVVEVEAIETPDHFLDWLQCLRSGQTTRAPLEAGYQHSVACLMAVEAYHSGRRTTYDHATRTISKV